MGVSKVSTAIVT